ncbi:hypothetical protein C0Q70_10261 [Pomacea canaliculata]|uniref:G-protein coupled receptors family 2 profile 2 domain-containing protein n=1 Tax=Pomacea canaliculata TaxID=400727 RepID=A0A2T7PC48_POMCA|nr:hypothetical protein C0Q70_10261 [Pomacea canaliculata]
MGPTQLLLLLCCLLGRVESNKVESDKEELMKKLQEARTACFQRKSNAVRPTDGVYCDMEWDNILCWNFTRAGTTAMQACPGFVNRLNPFENATRTCLPEGVWAPPPPEANITSSNGWTNFSACVLPPPTTPPRPYVAAIIKEHMPRITMVSKIGYSISLVALVLAIGIMLVFRRLYCQRNTIHINLFVSFGLRAIICLLRDSLLVRGLGLPQDVVYDQDGDISFNPAGSHWECKLLMTLFQLALFANYTWIFVEGLYLHTLIFFAVFSQKAVFKWYIILGWATPFMFLIPWVLVRIFKNNTLCWNTHEEGYYWILKGPIMVSIFVNFFFFLNIIRVLFTKLRATNTRDPQRYRKLAKSTLVLIPLFGVYYMFFIVINAHNTANPTLEVVLFYLEMTLNSFQVWSSFSWLRKQFVREEIKKKWTRHWLRRHSTVSARSSRAFSTTSFWFKERASISQGPAGDYLRRNSSRLPAVESSVSLRTMASAADKGVESGRCDDSKLWTCGLSHLVTTNNSNVQVDPDKTCANTHNGHTDLPAQAAEGDYDGCSAAEVSPMLKNHTC